MMNDDMQTVAFNSAAGLTVLNFWDQLLNRDRVYVVGFNDGQAEGQHPLVTGRVAMMWDGPWSISTLARHAQDLDYGVAPLPAGPDGHRGAGMGGFGLTIANGSRNVDAAWEFVKWLTVNTSNNAEFAYITGNIPANLEAAQDPRFTDDPHFAGILENMQFATIRPQVNGYASMEGNASIPVLQMFLSGERTAEQALAEAEAKGNQILADNR
jgi:multiple sugar transport system substrate-binding protein